MVFLYSLHCFKLAMLREGHFKFNFAFVADNAHPAISLRRKLNAVNDRLWINTVGMYLIKDQTCNSDNLLTEWTECEKFVNIFKGLAECTYCSRNDLLINVVMNTAWTIPLLTEFGKTQIIADLMTQFSCWYINNMKKLLCNMLI